MIFTIFLVLTMVAAAVIAVFNVSRWMTAGMALLVILANFFALVNVERFAAWEKWVYCFIVLLALGRLLMSFSRGGSAMAGVGTLIAALLFSFMPSVAHLFESEPSVAEKTEDFSAAALAQLEEANTQVQADLTAERKARINADATEQSERRKADDATRAYVDEQIGQLREEMNEANAAQDKKIADLREDVDDHEVRLTDVEAKVGELEAAVDGVTYTHTPKGMDPATLADNLAEYFVSQGFGPDDVVVGQVDWSKAHNQTGSNPISGQPLNGTVPFAKFVNGATVAGQAMRSYVESLDLSEDEKVKWLRGENFIPVQFTIPVCYEGNTHLSNGKVERNSAPTCYEAGDVIYIFVSDEMDVEPTASQRSACGNPNFDQIVPQRKERPVQQPEQPSQPATTTPATQPPSGGSVTPPKETTPPPVKPPKETTPPKQTTPPKETTPPAETTPPKETTPPPVKPTKDPAKHPCKVDPTLPECDPVQNPPAPAPTGTANPTPSNSPPPAYTPPPPPRPTASPTGTGEPTRPEPIPEPDPTDPVPTETAPPGDPCEANPSLLICD